MLLDYSKIKNHYLAAKAAAEKRAKGALLALRDAALQREVKETQLPAIEAAILEN